MGVTSNYAKLWTEFLKEIEGQGSQIKPVFAFAKAFETVSLDSSWLEGEPTILAFLAEPELDFRLVLQDFLSAGAVSGDD